MGYPKDSWVRAYLNGNLILPQAFEAGAIFISRSVLDGDPADLFEIKRADVLSESQLSRIRDSMHGAHRLRCIAAGDRSYLESQRSMVARQILIDDAKLTYIWNRFRIFGSDLAEGLACSDDGHQVARRLTEAFHTQSCRMLLRSFRAQYDPRNAVRSDSTASQLRIRIVEHVEEYGREGTSLPAGFLKSLLVGVDSHLREANSL